MRKQMMESPEHLHAWFRGKGYQNLTFRIADILQLPDKHVTVFDNIARRLDIGGAQEARFADMSPGRRLQTCCPMGFLLIHVDTLFACPWADMALLTDLQEATIYYREIRRATGHPEKVERCECGKSRKCRKCGGKGITRTVVEMSDEEIQLAHGGQQ